MVSTPIITGKMFGPVSGSHSSSKPQEAAPPSTEQLPKHLSRRGGSKGGKRRESKTLIRAITSCSKSLDDSEANNDGIETASKSASSFFGRFKQSRRPSIDNKLEDESLKRPSMGRRPSLGGSFTSRRPATERRPSMDNTNSARSQQPPADSTSSFPGSMSTKTSLTTSRRPSNGASDNGMSAATLRPPSLIVPTSFEFSSNSTYIQKPKLHPVIEALKVAMGKDHMLDLALIANNGSRIKTSRYLMACRVESLEHKLYPTSITAECTPSASEEDNKDNKTHCPPPPPAQPNEISLGDYPPNTLEALVEYCFCGELFNSTLKTEETADSVRGLVKLAELAWSIQFRVLGDETYQWARRMMNRNPRLACAFYDAATAVSVREFENYAMQTMEESPEDALIGGGADCGIQYLSAERLQAVLIDHEIELDELTLFYMLQRWVEQHTKDSKAPGMLSQEEALKIARKCGKAIKLRYIESIDLLSSVKRSGFFDDADIDKAIAEQAILSSRAGLGQSHGVGSYKNPVMTEHVEIQGAGLSKVNGIYVRQTDRDGQAMYSMGEGPDSIGLFQWEDTWGIAPSCDLSNMYYERSQVISSQPENVPMFGWTLSLQGIYPPPTCRWIAANADQDNDEDERNLPACYRSEEELYGN